MKLIALTTFALFTVISYASNELHKHEIEIDVLFMSGKFEQSRKLLEQAIQSQETLPEKTTGEGNEEELLWILNSKFRMFYLERIAGENEKALDQFNEALNLATELEIIKIPELSKEDRALVAIDYWLQREASIESKIDTRVVSVFYENEIRAK